MTETPNKFSFQCHSERAFSATEESQKRKISGISPLSTERLGRNDTIRKVFGNYCA